MTYNGPEALFASAPKLDPGYDATQMERQALDKLWTLDWAWGLE